VIVERLLDGEKPVDVRLLRGEPDRLARLGVVVDRIVAEDLDRAAGRLREPVVQWIRVDLPAPLGPSRPKNSPSSISTETPRSASTPVGYRFSRSLMSSAFMPRTTLASDGRGLLSGARTAS